MVEVRGADRRRRRRPRSDRGRSQRRRSCVERLRAWDRPGAATRRPSLTVAWSVSGQAARPGGLTPQLGCMQVRGPLRIADVRFNSGKVHGRNKHAESGYGVIARPVERLAPRLGRHFERACRRARGAPNRIRGLMQAGLPAIPDARRRDTRRRYSDTRCGRRVGHSRAVALSSNPTARERLSSARRNARFKSGSFDALDLSVVQLDQLWLDRCTFRGTDLRHATLDRCFFKFCDFSQANLREPHFASPGSPPAIFEGPTSGTAASPVRSSAPSTPAATTPSPTSATSFGPTTASSGQRSIGSSALRTDRPRSALGPRR